MNLRWFHALLILLSAALAVLFGVWLFRQGNGLASQLGAAVAFAVAIALVLYDSWFLRKTRTLR
jgi:glycerol-3-phosphate acyltransferase PlsY